MRWARCMLATPGQSSLVGAIYRARPVDCRLRVTAYVLVFIRPGRYTLSGSIARTVGWADPGLCSPQGVWRVSGRMPRLRGWD